MGCKQKSTVSNKLFFDRQYNLRLEHLRHQVVDVPGHQAGRWSVADTHGFKVSLATK
jgi:hypothetical protein